MLPRPTSSRTFITLAHTLFNYLLIYYYMIFFFFFFLEQENMIFKITHFYITGKLSPPPVATATEKKKKEKEKKKVEKTKESNYQFTLGHWEGHCSPPGSMLASCGHPHISHKCEQSDMGRLHMPCHHSMHSRLQPSSSWGQAPPCRPPRQPSEPWPELRLIGWTWHRGSGLPSQSWHSPGRGAAA